MDNSNVGPLPRIIAALIDGLLVALVLNVTFLRPNIFPGVIDIRALIVTAAFIVYEALMVFKLGTTVGKRIMGITIVDYSTQGRPTMRQCFFRPWVKLFFGIGIISNTFVAFMGILFSLLNLYKLSTDKEHRAIHDVIAGTLALRAKRQ
ncbi:MAG: RDD family protein [Actinobacteria bacterium]|nr:RDD family protein [Actinomycetota bacterium]